MLKRTAGLRPHGLTVRLVLVVLGRVESAGYIFPSLMPQSDYHTSQALNCFPGPSYRQVQHDVSFPE